MKETLISNHNSVVGVNDTTIHAGDFSFLNLEKTQEIIKQLNGNHVFLRGDHDKWMGNKQYQDMWKKRIEGISIIVSHYSMRVWWLSHYGSWNLYGHSHGCLEPVGKQHDIGVDNNNYFPISFDQLKDIMAKKPQNFNYIEDR